MNEKRPDLPEPERKHIAEIVAVGAIKFNDLSQNRTKDIVFDWDKMLSFEGNTAPYLQYSYARVKSILRKAQVEPEYSPGLLKEEQEKAVILTLAKFPEVLIRSAQEFAPHILAQYLLDTARTFTTFYSDITVLNNDDEKLTRARLGLVQAYADIIRQGLAILGIDVLERM
ncbi:MAG: arginine--tRNA ligase, partial [Vulcanimicrobiota bacterium]